MLPTVPDDNELSAISQSLSSWWWRLPLQEGVISWCNGENVGQYLGSIIIQDLRSILCHQLGPADHWYHRPLPFLLAQALDLLVGDIWICLDTACGFVLKNIYISRGFDFPYFRSSPLSISPAAEWHHIFLLNCPEKRTIFGTVCTSNSKEEYSGELFPLEIGCVHLVVTQICANRSSFWQNKGFVLHVCVASSDNRSWSLHLFTESTSGWKWTTSPTINSSECPPPWSCTSRLSNWSKSFSAKSTQNTPKLSELYTYSSSSFSPGCLWPKLKIARSLIPLLWIFQLLRACSPAPCPNLLESWKKLWRSQSSRRRRPIHN